MLLAPIALSEVALPNCIVLSPMCQCSAHEGTVGDWHVMHLGQFAVPGVGLVFVEATAVVPAGRITPGCAGLYCHENEAALAHVVRFCRDYGSVNTKRR